MIRSEGQDGLLPASYESGAKTRNRGARRSVNPRHCPEVLALACMHTTPGPAPASRKKGSMIPLRPIARARCGVLGSLLFRPHEQPAQNDRDEKESRHVTEQVAA